jgi:hypothetical protein
MCHGTEIMNRLPVDHVPEDNCDLLAETLYHSYIPGCTLLNVDKVININFWSTSF